MKTATLYQPKPTFFFKLIFVLVMVTGFLISGNQTLPIHAEALVYPVQGKNGMVVTGQELATRAGLCMSMILST